MSKQINNALSISRESGKSVKLETDTAVRHGEAGTPHPQINTTRDSRLQLQSREDQLWRPDGDRSRSHPQTRSRGQVQGPSPGPPRGSFFVPAGPLALVASQPRGETGLAGCYHYRYHQGPAETMVPPSLRQRLLEWEGRMTLRSRGSLTHLRSLPPRLLIFPGAKAQKKNTVF